MEANSSFKELFDSLCELLGESRSELNSRLGGSFEIFENFIYYPEIRTLFGIKDNQVFRFLTPVSDVKGHVYEGSKEFYSLDGVELEMTIDEVAAQWETPKVKDYYGLEYEPKTTKSGKTYTIGFGFYDDKDNIKRLKYLMATRYVKPSLSNEKPKSGCFIATACYGDYNATEVLVLRNYRDNVLLKTNLGRVAVNIYYLISPPIARLLDKSELLKAFIRKNILAPIISRIQKNQ